MRSYLLQDFVLGVGRRANEDEVSAGDDLRCVIGHFVELPLQRPILLPARPLSVRSDLRIPDIGSPRKDIDLEVTVSVANRSRTSVGQVTAPADCNRKFGLHSDKYL